MVRPSLWRTGGGWCYSVFWLLFFTIPWLKWVPLCMPFSTYKWVDSSDARGPELYVYHLHVSTVRERIWLRQKRSLALLSSWEVIRVKSDRSVIVLSGCWPCWVLDRGQEYSIRHIRQVTRDWFYSLGLGHVVSVDVKLSSTTGAVSQSIYHAYVIRP